ncbi:helix-turn-helix domain-containing protein [Rhodococcus sp. UNC363MFTsu5.1]|uniref:helix-turn-helix domain-containing protein n=1 Tax=Rhodococcus sp. UNC363MFTsu5.1 TaxID=1449069 RepID=UPI0009DE7215
MGINYGLLQTGPVATVGETRRGSGTHLQWAAVSATPAPTLAGLVSRYGGFREVSAMPILRRELPSPSPVLVISLAEPLSLSRPSGDLSTSAVLVGVGRTATLAAHSGAQTVLEARLSPLSALQLFGVPASDLTDRVVDLADLWDGAEAVVGRIGTAATWAERFHLLDSVLTALAQHGREVDPVLAGAWQQLLSSRGNLRMSALHDQTGWGRKRLADRFREQVGLTPKSMARLVRFHRAVNMMHQPGHRSLTAIASSCGYYDQAHLNREFRELAGGPPGSYLTGMDADPAAAGMAGI